MNFVIVCVSESMLTVQIEFRKCCEKNAGSLNEFCNRLCKREHVECDALKD